MRFTIIVSIICSFFLYIGCSSGQAPLTPVENNPALNSLPVYVSDFNPDGSPGEGMGVMGLFNLDYVDGDVSFAPIRRTSLTDVLEIVDITNFLTLAPCSDCVKLDSIAIDLDGNAVLSIGIKHPFGAGDIAKPISGQNRADLHVFNVEGIVISNSSAVTFSGIGESSTSAILSNADGYTDYLDDAIDAIYPTEATVHPYITHFDDYSAGNFNAANPTGFESVVNPPPSGNMVMAMGSDYDYQDYIFNLDPAGDFNLLFAVGCTYAVSAANKSQRFSPEYRVPQHNKKAASEVRVEIIDNQLRGGITSSYADLEIQVVDISDGVEVGEALNQMKADSSVGSVSLEIPGITSSVITVDGNDTSPTSGLGHDDSDPKLYEVTLINELGSPMGSYTGLVKVIDAYSPGLNEAALLGGLDGIERVSPIQNPLEGLINLSEFATYCVFEIDVAPGCGPITGEITSPICPMTGVGNGQLINFTVTASSDNGGDPVVLYEVDFDYDGVTFTSDDSNTDGIFLGVGPFTVPDPCPSNIPQDYTVAFRATDSCAMPNETIFTTCLVTVDNCLAPVGNVTIVTNREYGSLFGDMFATTGAWTLSWDSAPGAAEYAIYYDNDPGDYTNASWDSSELTDNLVYVGATTSTSYTVPSSHLPSDHWVVGNTYIVRSRSILGNPSSETADSEPAFVTCNGWETTGSNRVIGYNTMNNGEGWKAGWELDYNYTAGIYIEFPTTYPNPPYQVHGTNTTRISSSFLANGVGTYPGPGNWDCVVKQTPVVPNATVRFLDFAAGHLNSPNPLYGGWVIGTKTNPPGFPWADPSDFHWARAESTGDYTGYNNSTDTYLYTVFGDVNITGGPWCWTFGQPNGGERVGGDVNTNGYSSDPYVGIAGARNQHGYPYKFADEIAIMIY